MASKFMAFENVASTSSASMDQDEAGERIEMNSSQYPNYQTNHQMHDGAESTNTYGGGDGSAETGEEDDNFKEETEKDVGYRKFIYNNSEQFKCICGGELNFLVFSFQNSNREKFRKTLKKICSKKICSVRNIVVK